MKVYLASTSPRRRQLLTQLGIPFEVIEPQFEERLTSMSTADEALYFSEQKARSVEKLCPNALIIGSDTLIECNGIKMGKPNSKKEAIQMLQKLSGTTHHLFTAVVLLNTKTDKIKKHVEKVLVTFRELSEKEIQDYVASGGAMGKAGAYAIQEKGKAFVRKVEGELEAVVGLPLKILRKWLEQGKLL